MAKKIHFEDNLYYLSTIVQTMKGGLSIDIDPDFFLDKTIDDLFFADSMLAKTYSLLKENAYLIRRAEHMRSLLRAKRLFTEVLESILKNEFPFSSYLEQYFPKLQASLKEHSQDIREIQDTLLSAQDEAIEDEDLISEVEMRYLFTKDQEIGGD